MNRPPAAVRPSGPTGVVRHRLPATLPLRRSDVMTADFDTELVVLVPDERRVLHLDAGLSIVLDSCDGWMPVGQLVDEVADATGDPTEQVESWLADALRQLADLALVTEATR